MPGENLTTSAVPLVRDILNATEGVSFPSTESVQYETFTESSISQQTEPMSPEDKHDAQIASISLASWNFEELEIYLIVTVFILLSGLAKLVFHHLNFLSSRVPESCLLIIVGAISGAIISNVDTCTRTGDQEGCTNGSGAFPRFTPELFFYFLLPPIILESAYSLHNRVFMENLRTVLLYAVFGTILNFLLIGGSLILFYNIGAMGGDTVYKTEIFHQQLSEGNPSKSINFTTDISTEFSNMTSIQILLFSSLISAVDPVAVLAVFSEVGVNPDLYFLVFGESLLNDGVAVVLYNMMNAFAGMEHAGSQITAMDITIGIGSFFTVALGGLFIGFFFGILTAIVTKCTTEVRVLEPLATFGLAYLAYLTADLVNWSGIISLIGCGMLQAHYAFKNISEESLTTINYFIKMLSSTSDCIIFLYLGMALFGDHVWHTGFVCWALVVCLVVRFIGVFTQTFVVNKLRHGIKTINYQEQFIMAYGGLRGAVGFSLVLLINKSIVPSAGIFVTTTLAIVLCTVFIQGSTIKPLVNILKIDKEKEGLVTLSEEINEKLFEHVMAGVEVITGKMGHYVFNNKLYQFDQRFMKKWLCNPNYERKIERMYEKALMADHLLHLYGPTVMVKQTIQEQSTGSFENQAYTPEDGDTLDKTEKTVPSFKAVAHSVSWIVGHRNKIPPINRSDLTTALMKDPVNILYQVYDKNIKNTNINQIAEKRQKSAQKFRQLVNDQMERSIVNSSPSGSGSGSLSQRQRAGSLSTYFSHPHGSDSLDFGGSFSSNKIRNMLRKLEGLPREDRDAVHAALNEHIDLRRRKTIPPPSRNLSLTQNRVELEPSEERVKIENVDTTQL